MLACNVFIFFDNEGDRELQNVLDEIMQLRDEGDVRQSSEEVPTRGRLDSHDDTEGRR